jgi:hypothetical protein
MLHKLLRFVVLYSYLFHLEQVHSPTFHCVIVGLLAHKRNVGSFLLKHGNALLRQVTLKPT